MHKNLFGIAAILFGVAAVFHSLPSSHAQDFGPVVMGGEAPWIDFAGTLSPSTNIDVYTVPADRSLVITAASMSHDALDLWETGPAGDSLRVEGGSHFMNSYAGRGGALARGAAHIAFGPGTTLQLRNTDTSYTRHYTINGYLAAP